MPNESKPEYPDEDILAQFKSDEDFETWANSLIEVNAEDAWDFDPDSENNKSLTTSIQLSQHLIEGYQKLAVERGLSHPQPLIILALEEYLNKQTTSMKHAE
jgi:hypothetical protein